MAIIDGIDSNTRQPVYDPSASIGSKKAFWKAVGSTKAGQKLFQEFEINEGETGALIIQIAKDLNSGVRYITSDMAAAATEVIVYRPLKYGLKRKPAAPVVPTEAPVETPTDKNGRPLSPSQIAWGEMARWSNEHSADECRKRAASDAKFAQFRHTNLMREMNDEPVDAAIPAAVQATRSATGDDRRSELGAFAAAYKKAPASTLRHPIDGVFKLSFGRDNDGQLIERIYTPQEFESLLTESAKIGLL